jgi:hypothetical protein
MGSHIRNVLGKDLASIIGKYLLPDKNEMKKLYSSLIDSDDYNSYMKVSIISQYYYFRFKRNYKIDFIVYSDSYDVFIISFITPDIIDYNKEPFNDLYIKRYINCNYNKIYINNSVNLFIPIENIMYSDIIKYADKNTKNWWFKRRKSLKRNYL